MSQDRPRQGEFRDVTTLGNVEMHHVGHYRHKLRDITVDCFGIFHSIAVDPDVTNSALDQCRNRQIRQSRGPHFDDCLLPDAGDVDANPGRRELSGSCPSH